MLFCFLPVPYSNRLGCEVFLRLLLFFAFRHGVPFWAFRKWREEDGSTAKDACTDRVNDQVAVMSEFFQKSQEVTPEVSEGEDAFLGYFLEDLTSDEEDDEENKRDENGSNISTHYFVDYTCSVYSDHSVYSDCTTSDPFQESVREKDSYNSNRFRALTFTAKAIDPFVERPATETSSSTFGNANNSTTASINIRYQEALEMREDDALGTLKKYQVLSQLASDFIQAVRRTGTTIISELFLPDKQRTIKKFTNIGGHAGGGKYIHQGILYKCAEDVPVGSGSSKSERRFIYGGSSPSLEFAQKACGHDLQGAMSYHRYSKKLGVTVPIQVALATKRFFVNSTKISGLRQHWITMASGSLLNRG